MCAARVMPVTWYCCAGMALNGGNKQQTRVHHLAHALAFDHCDQAAENSGAYATPGPEKGRQPAAHIPICLLRCRSKCKDGGGTWVTHLAQSSRQQVCEDDRFRQSLGILLEEGQELTAHLAEAMTQRRLHKGQRTAQSLGSCGRLPPGGGDGMGVSKACAAAMVYSMQ